MVKTKCVHCGFVVHEFTADCPQCGKPVANKDAPASVSEPPWRWKATGAGRKTTNPLVPVMAAVAVLVVTAFVYFTMNL